MTDEENPATKARSPCDSSPWIKAGRSSFILSQADSQSQDLSKDKNHEILLQTAKSQLLVFKHALATIEIVDMAAWLQAERLGVEEMTKIGMAACLWMARYYSI